MLLDISTHPLLCPTAGHRAHFNFQSNYVKTMRSKAGKKSNCELVTFVESWNSLGLEGPSKLR